MIHAALIAAVALQAGPDTLRLGLRQAMDLAVASGYQAELAKSKSRELEGKIGESRGALLPHFGATASDVVRSFDLPAMGLALSFPAGVPALPNLIEPFNAQDARINGHISLFDAAAWKRYEGAHKDLEQGRWEEKTAQENAALTAAEAYLALLRARALMESRRSELSLASQLADLTRAQKQAGTGNQIDVLRAEGQVSTAKSALSAASGGEEHARYVLLRILGQDLDAVPALTDSLSLQEAAPGAPSDSAGMAARPEVAAADKQKEAAMAEMIALRSEILPTLDLAGDYGLSGRRLNDRAEWTETIALQLNWNIWDGGRRRARIGQQAEKVRRTDLLKRETRLAVSEELRESASAMKSTHEEATYALERAKLAEDEERLARERFRSGGSGNLEVITAQASVSLAHQAYIDALYGYSRARLEYLKAAHRMSEI